MNDITDAYAECTFSPATRTSDANIDLALYGWDADIEEWVTLAAEPTVFLCDECEPGECDEVYPNRVAERLLGELWGDHFQPKGVWKAANRAATVTQIDLEVLT